MLRPNIDGGFVLSIDPQSRITTIDAERLAHANFGLEVCAEPLAGEKDQNFLLKGSNGTKFILKIIHADEPKQRLDFQNELLRHVLKNNPALPVPRIIEQSRDETSTRPLLQCLTFLEGNSLHTTKLNSAIKKNVGRFQAELTLALANFRHPAQEISILWDTKNLCHFASLVGSISDTERRGLVNAAISRFETSVSPVLSSLRHQVIHNDFNRDNILVHGERITGLIDFGDIVWSPVVQDIATTCAYLATADSVMDTVCDVAGGFQSLIRLDMQEVSVLLDFIIARLALIIIIGSHKAALNPANAAYLLRNQTDAVSLLSKLLRQDRAIFAKELSNKLLGLH